MSRKFIISDTHFGHVNIIKLANRPFESVTQMDDYMIQKWNSVVRPNDEVWHLGDFSHRVNDVDTLTKIFKSLNGRKSLIAGNHDAAALGLPWVDVSYQYVGKLGPLTVHMHHYPLREWQGYYRGAVHLHGHVHGTLEDLPGSMDCGVERLSYTPIDVEEVFVRNVVWVSALERERPR